MRMIYPDSTLLGSDWIKVGTWDIPGVTDLKSYMVWRGLLMGDVEGLRTALRRDEGLPFWIPAPLTLKREAQAFLETGIVVEKSKKEPAEPFADPDEVDPFWETPEGKEMRRKLFGDNVKKYNPDQPRDSDGRFESGTETSGSENGGNRDLKTSDRTIPANDSFQMDNAPENVYLLDQEVGEGPEYKEFIATNDRGSGCDDISEAVEREFGIKQVYGIFETKDGRKEEHSWNVTPEGWIVDGAQYVFGRNGDSGERFNYYPPGSPQFTQGTGWQFKSVEEEARAQSQGLTKEWDESEHPRDSHGRFGEGSGSGVKEWQSTKGEEAKTAAQNFMKQAINQPTFTEKQSTGILHYVNSSNAMNQYLRNGIEIPNEGIGSKQDIEAIKSAMQDTTTKEPMALFRGVDASVLEGVKEGDIINDKGFCSTSLLQTGARPSDRTALMEISAPEGTHCVVPLLDKLVRPAAYEEEAEVVLPPNTSFRVDSIKVDGTYALSIVPSNAEKSLVSKKTQYEKNQSERHSRFVWQKGDVTVHSFNTTKLLVKEWDESKHPRDSHGRFGSNGGSTAPRSSMDMTEEERKTYWEERNAREKEEKKQKQIQKGIDNISKGLRSFNNAGGTVETLRLDPSNLKDKQKLESLLDESREIRTAYVNAQKESESKDFSSQQSKGYSLMDNAIERANQSSHVLNIARDSDGILSGALVNTEGGQIPWLGSTQLIPGTGSALVNAVIQDAAQKGGRVTGEPTIDASSFWDKVGANVHISNGYIYPNTLVFSEDAVQQIAAGVTASLNKTAIGIVTKRDVSDEQRDAHGRWTTSDIPAEPGSTPIGKDEVRFYHYTLPENLESIKTNGLQVTSARGETYGEPNLVWGSTSKQGYDFNSQTIVEYKLPIEELRSFLVAGSPGQNTSAEELTAGNHNIGVPFDVKPENIIAIHEPWQSTYRYIKGSDSSMQSALNGDFDHLTMEEYPKEFRAIQQIKDEAAKSTTKFAIGRVVKYSEDEPRLVHEAVSSSVPNKMSIGSYGKPFATKVLKNLTAIGVAVLKFDSSEPRDADGKWTKDGEVDAVDNKKQYLSTISSRTKEFYGAGGTVKIFTAENKDDIQKINNMIEEKGNKYIKELNTQKNGRSQFELSQDKLYRGYRYMYLSSKAPQTNFYQNVLVAFDSKNVPCSVLSFTNQIGGANPYFKVGTLGSDNSVPGAATALQYEMCKYVNATNPNASIKSETDGPESTSYHESIGRTLSQKFRGQLQASSWPKSKVANIANIDISTSKLFKYSEDEPRDADGKWTTDNATNTVVTYEDHRDFMDKHCTGIFQKMDYLGEKPQTKGLTKQQIKAVSSYVANSHHINMGRDKPSARVLQNAIAKNTIDTPVIMFRGIRDSALGERIKQKEPGSTFNVRGFSSSSLSQAEAEKFSNGTLLKISVDAGSHCLAVPGNEAEMILQSGARFRLDSVTREDTATGSGQIDVVNCTYLGSPLKSDDPFDLTKAINEYNRFVLDPDSITFDDIKKYSEDENRDARGRWTNTGADGVTDFKTWKDVKGLFNVHGISVDEKSLSSLGIQPHDMKIIADKILQTEAKFPGAMQELKQISGTTRYDSEDNHVAAAVDNMRLYGTKATEDNHLFTGNETQQEGSIMLLTNIYGDCAQHPEHFASELAKDPNQIVGTNIGDLITHEMGHVIQNMNEDDVGNAWVKQGWHRLDGALQQASLYAGYLRKDGRNPSGYIPDRKLIENDISNYATKTPAEFHSEVLVLFNNPAKFNALPQESQDRLLRYQEFLNNNSNSTIVKGLVDDFKPVTGIADDFGLSDSFWKEFYRFVESKSTSLLTEINKYSPDQQRDAKGRWSKEGDSRPDQMAWQQDGTSARRLAISWQEDNITSNFPSRFLASQEHQRLREEERTQPGIKNAIARYTTNNSNVNGLLRSGKYVPGDEVKEKYPLPSVIRDVQDMTDIQKAIDQSTIKSDVLVYRGISNRETAQEIMGLSEGTVITDKGFVSTTLLDSTARTFAILGTWSGEREGKQWEQPVFEIHLPAGSHAIGITGSEGEILLGSNSKFRIDGIDENQTVGFHRKVKMTYLGSGE